ncbi:Rv0909 family putative TA system antitoxin [Cellulosimicrobium sp. CUA-896]|uniref:Rv0909 family putative TA system antitoxin n=1 Tax=Cellulosimicrobium sp. CUA-896 TaxID=1517881 RepID=UPI00095BB913|nr:Rv0909 family putative TA system antitoxin [Cellulosimicrobium sp. CUA-896]OLT51723.1 antitoxin protein [Cellulosimicrobium sp. CUA-896]
MEIDDLRKKAGDALDSDKGEKASDAALDKGGDAASRVTGGKHDEQIDRATDRADRSVGNE